MREDGPADWRIQWIGVCLGSVVAVLGAVGLIAVKRWPDTLETIFGLIAFFGLCFVIATGKGLWDSRRNRRLHRLNFGRPRNDR